MKKRPNPATDHTQSRQLGAQTTSCSTALVRGRSIQFIANPCRWPHRGHARKEVTFLPFSRHFCIEHTPESILGNLSNRNNLMFLPVGYADFRKLVPSNIYNIAAQLACSEQKIIKLMSENYQSTHTCTQVKGGPEPLENEINKILGSKREDRFSDHFSDLVQNICSVRFSYLLRLSIFCKAPRDMRKIPQKCQKIAGC